MKKLGILVAASFVYALGACGSSTTGDDAGGGDATTDASGSDATGADGGTDSAPADSGGGDGGLASGDPCDLQNDQCGPGLKCCGGGAQLGDGGTGHCIPTPDSGKCPLIP